jgi:hypothetical protein
MGQTQAPDQLNHIDITMIDQPSQLLGMRCASPVPAT